MAHQWHSTASGYFLSVRAGPKLMPPISLQSADGKGERVNFSLMPIPTIMVSKYSIIGACCLHSRHTNKLSYMYHQQLHWLVSSVLIVIFTWSAEQQLQSQVTLMN
eukprot:scaffold301865_cov27-Prasinocladus_malaysianus.AAC.1